MIETTTKTKYIYWQDQDMFLGYLEEYPDYWTQGNSLEELQQNLLDLYQEFTQGNIPSVRKVAELELL
jgi:predicted RNase H-like HicB family nuclease